MGEAAIAVVATTSAPMNSTAAAKSFFMVLPSVERSYRERDRTAPRPGMR
jgi:hypothetical protein